MKLAKSITIVPPPFSDNNGKVNQPPPIITDELNLLYTIDPLKQIISVAIQYFPLPIQLFTSSSYDQLNGFWNQNVLENRLLQILGDDPAKTLRSLFPRTMEEDPYAPGTVLASMIKSIGIHMSDNCSCRRHALTMNAKGNEWCSQNVDTIVGWLREEAQRRGLPFVDMIGKILINRAIKKSTKLLNNQPVPDNDEDLDKE
jgi:hypothetical protein